MTSRVRVWAAVGVVLLMAAASSTVVADDGPVIWYSAAADDGPCESCFEMELVVDDPIDHFDEASSPVAAVLSPTL